MSSLSLPYNYFACCGFSIGLGNMWNYHFFAIEKGEVRLIVFVHSVLRIRPFSSVFYSFCLSVVFLL